MQWERVIVGDVHHPNPAAVPVLLAVVTITGVFDGICVGAMFGEAAVLGPASAHVSAAQPWASISKACKRLHT